MFATSPRSMIPPPPTHPPGGLRGGLPRSLYEAVRTLAPAGAAYNAGTPCIPSPERARIRAAWTSAINRVPVGGRIGFGPEGVRWAGRPSRSEPGPGRKGARIENLKRD